MSEKKCTACGVELRFMKRERLQLGQTTFLLGDWGNLWAGAQEVELWVCPQCRKLELYVPEDAEDDALDSRDGIAQTVCPACGTRHDLDDPRCPNCGAKNPKY